MKKVLVFSLLCLCISVASAHTIWIETSATGTIGKGQEVKVFLGEYASGERDSINHWFSNMKEFELTLTAPDGKQAMLTCKENGNYFSTVFMPDAAGIYTLSISHTVKAVYGGTKIQYYALASVNVNQSSKGISNLTSLTDLTLQTPEKSGKVNTPYSVVLLNKKSPKANGSVTVVSPAGWAKTFKTDEKGNVTFSPLWAGTYMFEASYSAQEKGTHEGQEYNSVWYCVTYSSKIE